MVVNGRNESKLRRKTIYVTAKADCERGWTVGGLQLSDDCHVVERLFCEAL
jgi:hypothetical protein